MSRIFRWLKIALITVLLTQHSFAIAKPMKCDDHAESTLQTKIDKSTEGPSHTSHSAHRQDSDLTAKHGQNEMHCQKCKAGHCSCCKGGFCAAFHLMVFATTENYGLLRKTTNLDSFFELKLNPLAGIPSPPYHPPKIS